MLAKRIIPCLDVNDGRVVKGVNFVNLRDAGDPVELAKFYSAQGADEIVFLDITATSDNRATIADVVRRTCSVKKVTSSHAKGETVILSDEDISEETLRAVIEPTGYKVLGYASEPYEKKGFSLFHWK